MTVKQYNTLETLQRLIRFREVMFKTIAYFDVHRTGAIPETQFYVFVIETQRGLSPEQSNEMGLVFDIDNLLQARIVNDRRSFDGVTKLMFNTSIIDVFRLCKISLYRPLTEHSLDQAMTPLWSLVKKLKKNNLSTVPGTDEYYEWVDDLMYRVSDLLGKISGNIAKLENAGQEFEKMTKIQSDSVTELAIKKESFKVAARMYKREIEPLNTFLDKHTRYEDGDGIFLTLEYFRSFFETIQDTSNSFIILSYELQYLDLFSPIKKVANLVSVYLQKTHQSLKEQSAIENAYAIVLQAYEKTLGSDMRTKFIDFDDLKKLNVDITTPSIGRLTPFRAEKSPSFLGIVFNELATRAQELNPEELDKVHLEEFITNDSKIRIEHSSRLARWTDSFKWPLDCDFIDTAHTSLLSSFTGYKLNDLFEVQSRLINSSTYQIDVQNEYAKIEDNDYQVQYRIRHLKQFKTKGMESA